MITLPSIVRPAVRPLWTPRYRPLLRRYLPSYWPGRVRAAVPRPLPVSAFTLDADGKFVLTDPDGRFDQDRACCCCPPEVDVTFASVALSNSCLAANSKLTALTGFNGTYTLPRISDCCGDPESPDTWEETFTFAGAHFNVYDGAACTGSVLEEWESTHVTILAEVRRSDCLVVQVRATLTLTCTVGAGVFPPGGEIIFLHFLAPIGTGPTALGAAGANDLDPSTNPTDGGTATVEVA